MPTYVAINVVITCLFSSSVTPSTGQGRSADPPPEIRTSISSSSFAPLTNFNISLAVDSATLSGRLLGAPSQILCHTNTKLKSNHINTIVKIET